MKHEEPFKSRHLRDGIFEIETEAGTFAVDFGGCAMDNEQVERTVALLARSKTLLGAIISTRAQLAPTIEMLRACGPTLRLTDGLFKLDAWLRSEIVAVVGEERAKMSERLMDQPPF